MAKNLIWFQQMMQDMDYVRVRILISLQAMDMLGDAKLSQVMANALLQEGIYVIGFFYPVVPKNEARIRVQLSAAHTKAQLDRALAAFEKVGRELGVTA